MKTKGKRDIKQEKQYSENQAKILKALNQTPMTPSAIKAATGLSYPAIRKHTSFLLKTGNIKSYKGELVSLSVYYEKVGETLKAYTQELQPILAAMSQPETIWRLRRESTPQPYYSIKKKARDKKSNPQLKQVATDSDASANIDLLTPAELQKLLHLKEEALGGMRSLFADFAKILLKVEGCLDVREDLGNVKFCFRDGKPYWTIHPNKKFPEEGIRFSSRKWNCRRCGKHAFIVLGTNGLCSACNEPPKESPES